MFVKFYYNYDPFATRTNKMDKTLFPIVGEELIKIMRWMKGYLFDQYVSGPYCVNLLEEAGELRKSITIEGPWIHHTEIAVKMRTAHPSAFTAEYGATILPKRSGGVLHFYWKRRGIEVFTRRVYRRPKPFMSRLYDDENAKKQANTKLFSGICMRLGS